MPTQRQLEVFLAAAEARSFRQAAELLDISQAAVSRQIDALERTVGGEVFHRRRGARAELSPLGLSLQRDATQMLQLQRRWTSRHGRPEEQAPQTVYVRSFLLESAIKPRLAELGGRGLPPLARFVVVDDADEMYWKVGNDRHAIGLLRTWKLPGNASIRSVTLRRDTCSLYAAPPVARQLASGALARPALTILLPLPGDPLSASMRQHLEAAGFGECQFRYGGQFNELLVNDAASGKGAVMLLDEHARELVASGLLVRLDASDCHLNLIIIAHRECQLDRFERLVDVFSVL